ncbi:MAG: hypothetical protein QNK84_03640 [Flavobacteriales bacterium]|jgi:hypothetical protein|tara:strand:- start:4890 stop:5285 length:396 start_codon:yes stop_codon:yes gene_type:complete
MMRNFLYIVITILIASCSPQKLTSSSSPSSGTEIKNLGSKIYGKVIVKSVSKGTTETPVLYFDTYGVEYFIDFSSSKVTKAEISKFVYKDIDVLGEIKTEGFSTTQSKTREEQENGVKHKRNTIVIYKILD